MWDRWLRNHLPRTLTTHQARYRLIDESGNWTNVTPYKGNPKHIELWCVCADCNNTWMSKLTNAAKPHVVKLLSADPLRVTELEQRRLASWIAVKASIAEFHERHSVSISAEDRKFIYDNKRCPDGWRVWIGNFERTLWKTDYSHEAYIMDLAGLNAPPTNPFSKYNTHSTTYIVGKLFILVITSFDPSVTRMWSFRPALRGFLKPIWPLTGYSFAWPPPKPSTINDEIAADLSGALMAVAISTLDGVRNSE